MQWKKTTLEALWCGKRHNLETLDSTTGTAKHGARLGIVEPIWEAFPLHWVQVARSVKFLWPHSLFKCHGWLYQVEERGVVVVGGKGTRKTDIFQSHLSAACYGVAAVRYRSKCKVPIFLLFLSSETDLACNTQYIDISTVRFQTRVGELLRKQRTGTRRGGGASRSMLEGMYATPRSAARGKRA